MENTTIDGHMRRGFDKLTPRMWSLDQESHLDFMKGLRDFGMSKLGQAFGARAEAELIRHKENGGAAPTNFDEMRSLLERIPLVQFRNRLMRSSQEMKYNAVIKNFNVHASAFETDLDLAALSGPSTLELDSNFKVPQYYEGVEFHIKPGNYDGMQLAGLQYHFTMNMFTAAGLTSDQQNAAYVSHVPTPTDGKVNRVLDLACSIGQSATALKERFDSAEVTAIDVAAPMLRYATLRANRMGVPITFSQQAAENLSYPDEHFDIVYAYILFHELPEDAADAVIREAHRVLRPGGLFVVVDFPPNADPDHYDMGDYVRAWDAAFNGEPYSVAFVRSNFENRLAGVFSQVEGDHHMPGVSFIKMRVATK